MASNGPGRPGAAAGTVSPARPRRPGIHLLVLDGCPRTVGPGQRRGPSSEGGLAMTAVAPCTASVLRQSARPPAKCQPEHRRLDSYRHAFRLRDADRQEALPTGPGGPRRCAGERLPRSPRRRSSQQRCLPQHPPRCGPFLLPLCVLPSPRACRDDPTVLAIPRKKSHSNPPVLPHQRRDGRRRLRPRPLNMVRPSRPRAARRGP